MSLYGGSKPPPYAQSPSIANTQSKICTPSRQRTHLIHARLAFIAGVQTMRARICSALSCDMFARVVWLRLRRAQNYRFLLCSVPYTLATHCFLRLTRARRTRFGRRTARVLLADFWYFWSCKSTIKEKYDKTKVKQNKTTTRPPHIS